MQERNDEYINIIYRILTFIFPLLYLSIKLDAKFKSLYPDLSINHLSIVT